MLVSVHTNYSHFSVAVNISTDNVTKCDLYTICLFNVVVALPFSLFTYSCIFAISVSLTYVSVNTVAELLVRTR